LTKQLWRARSLLALAIVAAVPLIAGVTTASSAGARNGTQGGLYGAATFSALNHTVASLDFTAPLLLALVVALFGSALGAADRDWGTLRYLYVRPVSPAGVLVGKWWALVICAALATLAVVVPGLIVGVAIFGWHSFHRIGATSLTTGVAAARLLAACGYVTLCTLSVGAVALALGTLLPGAAEALGASVALVIAASILDGQGVPGAGALPTHYWQRWTALFDGAHADLIAGVAMQCAMIALALAVTWIVATRRDPAA
jgi:ABC-type transport system involved in multi-copper enzyme maturation permease subunit